MGNTSEQDEAGPIDSKPWKSRMRKAPQYDLYPMRVTNFNAVQNESGDRLCFTILKLWKEIAAEMNTNSK